jgi:prepilin-type N-terminal cleavage/methylation domain-containing protein
MIILTPPRDPGRESGFTVVELLVAISIFVVFLGIAFGVFVQAVKGQRELTRFFAVQNNAALVLEQVMREVRTGYWFCDGSHPSGTGLPLPCESDADSLTFVNHGGQTVTYALDNGAVVRSEGSAPAVALTSDVVRVSNLRFLVTQMNDKCAPPRITIALEVGLAGAGNVAPIPLETSVASRVLPIDVKDAPDDIRSTCAPI